MPETSNTQTSFQSAASRSAELIGNPPEPFTGKRDELDNFLCNVLLHFILNDEIYDTDQKKITYTLSLMNGDAKYWKEQFLQNTTTGTGLTWMKFRADMKEAFIPHNEPGDALKELTTLKMGNSTIEAHISRYKFLLSRSRVPESCPSVIDNFIKTLNVPLQMELPTPPKDLKEWYEWAWRLDNNY